MTGEIAKDLNLRYNALSPRQKDQFNRRRKKYPDEPMLKSLDEVEKDGSGLKLKSNLKFQHTESDKQRVTMVSNISKEEALKLAEEYRKKGVSIKVKDGSGHEHEFVALDFKTVRDKAGDAVLHYKVKGDKSGNWELVVYLLTSHPDTLNALDQLRVMALVKGAKEVRDFREDVKEQMEIFKKEREGTLKAKEGVHPMMEKYLPDELKPEGDCD